MDASPRGPNQPIKTTLAGLRRVPMSAIATGSIRTTVRLRTAYSADRSIAIVDVAVRRRFAFVKLWPQMNVSLNMAGL
jgi:hypothetical protein